MPSHQIMYLLRSNRSTDLVVSFYLSAKHDLNEELGQKTKTWVRQNLVDGALVLSPNITKIPPGKFTLMKYTFILFLLLFLELSAQAQPTDRLRTLVLTDIENEPDDAQSLLRLLTYANQWDIDGLIATTSIWKKTTIADWRIYEILEAYEKVQSNLSKHEEGYPVYQELKSKVKKGFPKPKNGFLNRKPVRYGQMP